MGASGRGEEEDGRNTELLEEEIMRSRKKTMVGNKELLVEEKRRNLEPEIF